MNGDPVIGPSGRRLRVRQHLMDRDFYTCEVVEHPEHAAGTILEVSRRELIEDFGFNFPFGQG